MSRCPHAVPVVFRDELLVSEVIATLRHVMRLGPRRPVPGERAASVGRAFPPIVEDLDAAAWIAWCLTGLLVCSQGALTMSVAKAEAKRVVIAVAMLRADGNISAAADALRTSRKVLRENLRGAGLYPWPEPVRGGPGFGGRRCERCAGIEARRRRKNRTRQKGARPARVKVEETLAPEVVEDGTRGTVRFRLVDDGEGRGMADLVRGRRVEALFRGRQIHQATAHAYARAHRHQFSAER